MQVGHPHDAAPLQALVRRPGLEAGLCKLQFAGAELYVFSTAQAYCHVILADRQNHTRQQAVRFFMVEQGVLDRLVGALFLGRQFHISFRAGIATTTVVVEHAIEHAGYGRLLVRQPQRGIDLHAADIDVVAKLFEHALADEFGQMRRLGIETLRGKAHRQMPASGGLVFRIADETQRLHAPKHIDLSAFRTARIDHRVIGRRGLGQTRQHGGFGDINLFQRFAEIDLGGSGKAIGALAEVDVIDIQLEDFVLFPRKGRNCAPLAW